MGHGQRHRLGAEHRPADHQACPEHHLYGYRDQCGRLQQHGHDRHHGHRPGGTGEGDQHHVAQRRRGERQVGRGEPGAVPEQPGEGVRPRWPGGLREEGLRQQLGRDPQGASAGRGHLLLHHRLQR